ncbi:MAG: hypothetical protein V7K15_24865 [Nostoc sp.]
MKANNRPTSPEPRTPSNESGSGTSRGFGSQTLETLLVSSVTAPFCAKALPHSMFAPVVRVMLRERWKSEFERYFA